MNLHPSLKRFISLIMTLLFIGVQFTGSAQAAMVGTYDLLQTQQEQGERARLMALFERDAVKAQLVELGVDPEHAKQRVSLLSDAEVSNLNQQIAELPAGGSVLGILLVIFIVFVITDVIGATDIFPFIHPVK